MTKLLAALPVLLVFQISTCEQSGPARNDREYCAQLADMYERYVGSWDLGPAQETQRRDVEGRLAVDQCRAGNTVSSIPVLERKLLQQGFTLPKRA